MRTSFACLAVVLAVGPVPADELKVPDEIREKAVAQWRAAYDKEVKRWTDQRELGLEKQKTPATARSGRLQVKEADAELAKIKAEPYRHGPYIPLSPKAEKYGFLYQKPLKVLKSEKSVGTTLEYRVITREGGIPVAGFGAPSGSGQEKLVKGKYLLPGDPPKGAVVGRDFNLIGLYYVVEVEGDESYPTASILPIEIPKDKLPKK